jgi:hypothetical protein|nr:MAG TPA: chromosomal replication initiator protein [Caudoviricetes sp.]
MCKSEIFAKIINIVSKETEVSVDQILSSDKNMETVDARYLLVSLHSLRCLSKFPSYNIILNITNIVFNHDISKR